ncbi:hypothetical protein AVEN_209276-1 [Araneus ventricosus]|uniref:Uncharacterized protein n=1 Tax=Araneus ventricosus TaxID=182803 RepID=A0A4Y2CAU3_ARAVE|nr:hypothetical protein AVEN_209276-1 [Araneus ventricosus]
MTSAATSGSLTLATNLATLEMKYGISKVLESSRYLYSRYFFSLGEKIRHECARSFHVTSRLPGKLYKESAWTTEGVFIDWDRLGARTPLEFYPQCELERW